MAERREHHRSPILVEFQLRMARELRRGLRTFSELDGRTMREIINSAVAEYLSRHAAERVKEGQNDYQAVLDELGPD